MSASMVRKSLAIVDSDFCSSKDLKTKRKHRNIRNLIPENHKIIKKVNRKGFKEKIELLQTSTKKSVEEARKTCRSAEDRVKENLNKLKLIQEACTIELDQDITNQLIERAVTRRPVKTKKKSKKEEKTAFTEEDFASFEAEYFDE